LDSVGRQMSLYNICTVIKQMAKESQDINGVNCLKYVSVREEEV